MLFSKTTIAVLASLASVISARIVGFTTPAQIVPGHPFDANITTEGYIQSIQDISIVFGIAPIAYALSGTLGTTLLSQQTLGDALSNTSNNITASIDVSANLALGKSVLAASLFSLTGSRYSPAIMIFNVTVDVVEAITSNETVSSVGSINIY